MEGLSRLILPIAAEESLGWGMFFYVGIAILAMLVFIAVARQGLHGRVFKNPLTLFAEHAYLFAEHLCVSVIGSHGRKYVPFILTIWLYIFTSNLIGLVLPHSPSADWSLTLGMAIVVFVYVQWEGIRANGAYGHVRHFAGPKLPMFLIPVMLLVFVIELLSELMKILSLSIRLYGNIFAGHMARGTIDKLVPSFPLLGSLILPLEFLVAIIQAFVFTLLTTIYLSLVTGHGHDESHDTAEAHHDAEPLAA